MEDTFKMVSSTDVIEFQKKVNELLNQGYKLQGLNTTSYETHNGARASVNIRNTAWFLIEFKEVD